MLELHAHPLIFPYTMHRIPLELRDAKSRKIVHVALTFFFRLNNDCSIFKVYLIIYIYNIFLRLFYYRAFMDHCLEASSFLLNAFNNDRHIDLYSVQTDMSDHPFTPLEFLIPVKESLPGVYFTVNPLWKKRLLFSSVFSGSISSCN